MGRLCVNGTMSTAVFPGVEEGGTRDGKRKEI